MNLYAYRKNIDGEISTIISASDFDSDYQNYYAQSMSQKFEHTIDVEYLSTIDMAMADGFDGMKRPVIKLVHSTTDDQDIFFEKYSLKEINHLQGRSRQEDMISAQQKKDVDSEERKARLVAEVSGEVYVSPSIEEIHGLNFYDPFKKEVKNQNLRDDTAEDILQERMFGGADEQRRDREEKRQQADPSYKPMVFGGFNKEENDTSFDSIVVHKKSTMENPMTVEKSSAPVPYYCETEENLKTLEELNKKLETQKQDLVYGDKSNFRLSDSKSINVNVDALGTDMKKVLKNLFESNGLNVPHTIMEYWFPINSRFEGYYPLPGNFEGNNEIKNIFTIVSNDNIKSSATKSINFGSPIFMMKKTKDDEAATILYASTYEYNSEKIVEVFLVRIQ